jgi:hypothetical protein
LQPKLDNLFALPTAALTLQTELDLVTSGEAGLCFKSGSGEATIATDADLEQLLNFDEADDDKVSITTDDLGFKWLVVEDADDLESQVTRIHSANTNGGTRFWAAPPLCRLRLRAQRRHPVKVPCAWSTS